MAGASSRSSARCPSSCCSVDSVELPAAAPRSGGTLGANLAALWRRPMRRTTVTLWIAITFACYGFFTWIPSLLVHQIPGYYSAAFVSEKLDRKWTIVLYMILGGVSAYGMSGAGSDVSITTMGFLLSFFMNGTYAGIYAYTPELYPTAFRTTGMGVASAFGRIGGLSAPIVIGYAYPRIGFGGVFLVTTIVLVLVLGALAVGLLGIATAGKSLEQIAAETQRPVQP